MMRFRDFLEASEEESNVKEMLAKLPDSHRALVKGYKWRFTAGNTLDKDDQHIGLLNHKQKSITVAGPWNYGREFTALHEIGHRVWEKFMTPDLKKEWSKVVKNTKHKVKQNDEELFCHAYANHFARNKIEVHSHPEWDSFMKKIPG